MMLIKQSQGGTHTYTHIHTLGVTGRQRDRERKTHTHTQRERERYMQKRDRDRQREKRHVLGQINKGVRMSVPLLAGSSLKHDLQENLAQHFDWC